MANQKECTDRRWVITDESSQWAIMAPSACALFRAIARPPSSARLQSESTAWPCTLRCPVSAIASPSGTACLSASVTNPERSECAPKSPLSSANSARLFTMSVTACPESGSPPPRSDVPPSRAPTPLPEEARAPKRSPPHAAPPGRASVQNASLVDPESRLNVRLRTKSAAAAAHNLRAL